MKTRKQQVIQSNWFFTLYELQIMTKQQKKGKKTFFFFEIWTARIFRQK